MLNYSTNSTNTKNTTYTDITIHTIQTLPTLSTDLIKARNKELAMPLLIIAGLCDNTILSRVFEVLMDVFSIKQEEESETSDSLLIIALSGMVKEKKFYKITDITNLMAEQENQSWVNTKWVGRAIKRLGISKTKRVVNGRVQIILDPEVIAKKAADMGIEVHREDENVVEALPKDDAIKKIIKGLCFVNPNGAPMQDVLAEAETQGIDNAEDLIEKMKQHGILFEPRFGVIRVVE
jgi:hypothetical protein